MSLEAKSKTPNQIISEIDRPLKMAEKWVPLNDAVTVIEANHKNWAFMFADQEKRHDVRAKYIAQLEINLENANRESQKWKALFEATEKRSNDLFERIYKANKILEKLNSGIFITLSWAKQLKDVLNTQEESKPDVKCDKLVSIGSD